MAGISEVDDLRPYHRLGFGETTFNRMIFLRSRVTGKGLGSDGTPERGYGHVGSSSRIGEARMK